MQNVKRILAAIDFSARFDHVLNRAALLCADIRGGELHLLAVKDPRLADTLATVLRRKRPVAETMLVERTLRHLQHIAAPMKARLGMYCECDVRFGRPVTETMVKADELPADVTVIGTRGEGFLKQLFALTTADKLLHVAKRPVLVVRNEPQHAYREVLVPVDFSDGSAQAAAAAFRIAPGAHITFLHAFELWFEGKARRAGVCEGLLADYRTKAVADARRNLDQFIADLGVNTRRASSIVSFGALAPVINAYVRTIKPDLIVTAKHWTSRVEELLASRAMRNIVDQTSCDVLVIPVPPGSGCAHIGGRVRVSRTRAPEFSIHRQ